MAMPASMVIAALMTMTPANTLKPIESYIHREPVSDSQALRVYSGHLAPIQATRINRVASVYVRAAYERWQAAATRAASYALSQRGKPYRYGATGPGAYDCSGLVQRAWGKAGVRLPRVTWDQYRRVRQKVSRRALRLGDLVFFHAKGHVGMYVGRGKYVHAPQTGDVVRVAPLGRRRDFAGAVRPAWPVWLSGALRHRR